MVAQRLCTIADYTEICGLAALQKRKVIHYHYALVGDKLWMRPLN